MEELGETTIGITAELNIHSKLPPERKEKNQSIIYLVEDLLPFLLLPRGGDAV